MRWLVIGIGNPLRGDDGIGPWLAERVAAWNLPDVESRRVHQLTPELAADIAMFDRVLFLDAGLGPATMIAEIAADAQMALGHAMSPGNVLSLAESLWGRRVGAWLAASPASEMGFGERLSRAAVRECEAILPTIRDLLQENAACMKSA